MRLGFCQVAFILRQDSPLCRLSESLWHGADQYCVEDEGVVAGVCDEEDGEGLIVDLNGLTNRKNYCYRIRKDEIYERIFGETPI